MKKKIFGRKLKRDVKERKALFKSLLSELVLNEKIKTTEVKAKAVKAEADKLIRKARKEKRLAQRLLSAHLHPKAIKKIVSDTALRFGERKGGYVRIVKLGERLSDNARMAIIEWVEKKAAKPSIENDAGLKNKENRKVKESIKKRNIVKKKSEKIKTKIKKSK